MSTRKKVIAGNWKMYTTASEAVAIVRAMKAESGGGSNVDVVVCPPFTSIVAAVEEARGSSIHVGAQDMHWEDEGAYTGEVSAKMLLTLGCRYVIIGHSERRQYFFETDFTVNAKLKKALSVGLLPIVCVGETLDQREAGLTREVVRTQVLGAFDRIATEDFPKAVIAYEPVWAIGTGKTATPQQAQEVHQFIRNILKERFGPQVEETIILYGGSVKPENAGDLFRQKDIDGGLVGGASLNAESFLKIIDSARVVMA